MQSNLYFTDLNFLNKYFTTKEFDFINNVTLGDQNLDILIDKETNIRDLIVNFINNLDNSNTELKASNSNLAFISELQNIFKKVNDNLQMMSNLKNDFSKISEKIITLLIQIESTKESPEKYSLQIQEIKNMINSYNSENKDIQTKININNMEIEEFLRDDTVKNYFLNYDIDANSIEKFSFNNLMHKSKTLSDSNVLEENNVLKVSEKLNKVFLPYTKSEISLYLEQYPNAYTSFKDVVKKEFILPLDYYMKHPVIARFREAYSLIKDRESKSVMDALKYAFNLMFKYELNPVIIAACKTQEQLENYLNLLSKNKLDEFKDFEIIFEVSLKK